MKFKETHIINEIKETVRSAEPGAEIILFGSRARGDTHKYSDWDILILLEKTAISRSDFNRIAYPLYEYGWEIGELISAKIYTKKEWEKRKATLFYKNVQNEGIKL